MFNVKLFSNVKFFIIIMFIASIDWILFKKKFLKSLVNNNKIIVIKETKVIIKKFIFTVSLNISFAAIEVIYMNKISIPPKKIKKSE